MKNKMYSLIIKAEEKKCELLKKGREDKVLRLAVFFGAAAGMLSGSTAYGAPTDLENKINEAGKKLVVLITGISTVLAALATAAAVLMVFFSSRGMENAWAYIKKIWLAWGIINALGWITSFLSGVISSEANFK